MTEINTGELYEGEFSKIVTCENCGADFETNITHQEPYYCSETCEVLNSILGSCCSCDRDIKFGEIYYRIDKDGRLLCEECMTKRTVKDVKDNVNHPTHYTAGKIECIDYIQDKLTDDEFRGYIKGNVLKYLTRERHKNGNEDIKKAQWYLNRLVDVIGETSDETSSRGVDSVKEC